VFFPNNWISFHENGDAALYPMFAAAVRSVGGNLDMLEKKDLENIGRDFLDWNRDRSIKAALCLPPMMNCLLSSVKILIMHQYLRLFTR
jgi:hypothetical protein